MSQSQANKYVQLIVKAKKQNHINSLYICVMQKLICPKSGTGKLSCL